MTNMPSGNGSSHEDVEIIDILASLDDMLQRLARPIYMDPGKAVLRAQIIEQPTSVPSSIEDIMLSLKYIIDALANPMSIEPGSGRQRVSIEAGSVGQSGTWTVGISAAQTLATLTSMSQMSGYVIKDTLLFDMQDTAWAATIRGRVT